MGKRNPKAAEREARVIKALAGIQNGTYKSLGDAAKQLNVSRSTLCDRMNQTKSRAQARQDMQNLTPAEEKALVRWITQVARTGFPARHSTVREMAEAIRLRRVSEINACNAELISYEPLGKNWVSRFVKRHPQLGTARGRAIESSRIKETTPEKLRQWFDEFKRFVDEHNVDPKNIYNMDETGFSIGT